MLKRTQDHNPSVHPTLTVLRDNEPYIQCEHESFRSACAASAQSDQRLSSHITISEIW